MIFTLPKETDQYQWHKKFALLPICIGLDSNGKKHMVWLGYYEEKYEQHRLGMPARVSYFYRRLPGSETSYTFMRFGY